MVTCVYRARYFEEKFMGNSETMTKKDQRKEQQHNTEG